MSSRCRAVFERGRFFIETGSAHGFAVFHTNSEGIVRFIPPFIIKRIQDLINTQNTESAVTLWMHACESADQTTTRLFQKYAHVGLHLLEAAAIVVFIYATFRILS